MVTVENKRFALVITPRAANIDAGQDWVPKSLAVKRTKAENAAGMNDRLVGCGPNYHSSEKPAETKTNRTRFSIRFFFSSPKSLDGCEIFHPIFTMPDLLLFRLKWPLGSVRRAWSSWISSRLSFSCIKMEHARFVGRRQHCADGRGRWWRFWCRDRPHRV